ncbi:hypothetical protein RSOLAG22IIIB_07872 [Rhizoctonia solani]|uniref:F-box domain-containing protein n=1 Tax=Rhizoctonia solani TaxID=456999 RepID=A0A0K6FQW6_9AGAM|nr:hypothetical protein RSOLAG22IIIB_07872 [Rhizoctonia solani]
MGTRGYFAYRYKGKRFLGLAAFPSTYGQHFADTIPRDPSAFKDWVVDTINKLENAKTSNEEVVQPLLSEDNSPERDHLLGYELCEDVDWTFVGAEIEYTYVIDLDNRVFTVNGMTHLKLDNMPPSEPGLKAYFEDETMVEIPAQHLTTTVNLWPALKFDTAERQRKYGALHPIVTPAQEWDIRSWDELSFPQRVTIDLTHCLLDETAGEMAFAYVPRVRKNIGIFCWNILCTATTSVPIGCDLFTRQFDQILSTPSPRGRSRFRPTNMVHRTSEGPFKQLERNIEGDYCWVRGCLITFCLRLGDPAYVAHEVEQMVQKMHRDGHTECVGIILSSQQEVVAVAIDGGLWADCQVRHTPVLNISPCPDRPGEASEGLLLLVHLLSPISTVPQLPWRTPQPPSSIVRSPPKIPLELFQHIIRYTNTRDYVSLCRVSRSIRSLCLANPRFGDYMLLYKIPGYQTMYAAQNAHHDTPTVLGLYWDCSLIRRLVFSPIAGWNAKEYELVDPGDSEDEDHQSDGDQSDNKGGYE